MTSIPKAADDAVDQVKTRVADTAARTRAGLIELATQGLKLATTLRAMETRTIDSALGRVGLRRQQSSWVPIMWFVGGAVAAGGAAFLLTPSGRTLRQRIAKFLDSGERVAVETVKQVGLDGAARTPANGHAAAP